MPLNNKTNRYFLTLVFFVTGCVLLWTKYHARFGQQRDGMTPGGGTNSQSGQLAVPPPAAPVNAVPAKGMPRGVPLATASTNSSASTLETNRLNHPGIDGFPAWARELQEASTRNTAAAVVARGEALAKNRRSELAELIQTDPQQALAAAVPMSVRQKLPPEITRHLEERVSGRGSLAVLVADNFETGQREVSREVTIGPRRYTAFVYGPRANQGSIANVSLHGIAIDGKLAVHEDAVRPVEPGEVSWTDAASMTCPVSGQPATIHHQPAAAEVAGKIEFFCGASHIQQLNQRLAADAGGGGGGGGGVVAPDSWSQGTRTLLFMRLNFPDDPNEPISESDAYALLDGVGTIRR